MTNQRLGFCTASKKIGTKSGGNVWLSTVAGALPQRTKFMELTVMAKDAVVRFTDTLAEMRTLGIPALTNMAECIRRGTASRTEVMRDIGTHLSLGFYWNHSDENREQRKLVRACLMLRVILG
ncbi:MAG: hypothetical protein HC889_00970, partial [Synechococcaceae cyanobacterium SM1_2_3]|nr:hypothetical protein [Synechococcaceae cyanobacterium SM1_2_3]